MGILSLEQFKADLISRGWGSNPDDTDEALKVLYRYHIESNKTLRKVEERSPVK